MSLTNPHHQAAGQAAGHTAGLARRRLPLTRAAAALLGLLALLSACASADRSQAALPVEDQVDLTRYAGLWYEIARLPNRFERGCVGVTAEYALSDDGGVSVTNTCREDTLDGPTRVAEGRATVADPSNAKLKVKFAPAWVPFAAGDYWIIDVDDAYQTALVGAPSRKYLWILARTPQVAPERLDALTTLAASNGFEIANLEWVEQDVGAQASGADASGYDAQLAALTNLLVGNFASDAAGGAREGRPIHMAVREIAPPVGHDTALYAEMRHDSPDGPFYRQRIYFFAPNPDAANSIVMDSVGVADPEIAGRLIAEPQLLAAGEVATTPPIGPGCKTVWTPIADGFEGYVDPAQCQITGKRGDQRLIEARSRITPAAIEQLERGYDMDGTLLFGNRDDTLYVWPRVSP